MNWKFLLAMGAAAILAASASAVPRKTHTVVLGAAKKVAYSQSGDPSGALPGEQELTIRPLLVDGLLKDWTTGNAHDVTDRSFVVRRAIRLNDALPSDPATTREPRAAAQWVWQRGPWMLVDRVTGRITPLKLPDYDPGISQVIWFRDFAAYCGLTPSGKSVFAIVAQIAGRRPLLAKKLSPFTAENHPNPACGPPEWQRQPLRITFHPAGKSEQSFDLVPGSAVLVEESDEESDGGTAEGK